MDHFWANFGKLGLLLMSTSGHTVVCCLLPASELIERNLKLNSLTLKLNCSEAMSFFSSRKLENKKRASFSESGRKVEDDEKIETKKRGKLKHFVARET